MEDYRENTIMISNEKITTKCTICGTDIVQNLYDSFGRRKSKIKYICSGKCKGKKFVQKNPEYYKKYYEENPEKYQQYIETQKMKKEVDKEDEK